MKSQVTDALSRLANSVNLDGIARRVHRRQLLIVCYHGITADETSSHWLLRPSWRFEEDLRFLIRHYDVLPLEAALKKLEGQDIIHPTAAITFDDGYANNLSVALPLLERYGAPATIYLTTNLIKNGETLWTTRLEYALRESRVNLLQVEDNYIDGPLGSAPSARENKARAVKEYLKQVSGGRRQELLARIFDQVGEPEGMGAFKLLTLQEVVELDKSGVISFGAHSMTHPILSTLSDREVENEIKGSIADVGFLRNVTRTFAYPNGSQCDFDDRAITVLRSCGIHWALTTMPGLNPVGSNPYKMRRLVVGGAMTQNAFVALASGVLRR